MELILFFATILAFIGFAYVGGLAIVAAVKNAFPAPQKKSQAVKTSETIQIHPVYVSEPDWKKYETPTFVRNGWEPD
jgi:hypothetical protein